jgi:hypothetical protein
MKKPKKIKHKTSKFFGFRQDAWARLNGRWGRRMSYGHYTEYSDQRTRAEIRNRDDRNEEEE